MNLVRCRALPDPAAHQAGPLCRWIVPYSEQFKFIWLSHVPFVSKRTSATWINAWLASLYAKAGIEHVQPEEGSDCNFTGQCNDAFFRLPLQVQLLPSALAHPAALLRQALSSAPRHHDTVSVAQGKVRYVVDAANDMRVVEDAVVVGEQRLHADVLVTARACPAQLVSPAGRLRRTALLPGS